MTTRREACAMVAAACMGAWTEPVTSQQVSTDGFPRQVTDALGRQVTIPVAPQRIVLVFPSNVEIAWSLGLEDRVVAIGGRVRWPEAAKAKPSIGGALGYSPEVLAAFKPDLVVVTTSHHTALSVVSGMSRVGVPCIVLAHPDLKSVLRNVALMGEATGMEADAQRVRASMLSSLEAVAKQVAGHARPSVYLETAAAARGAFQTMGQGHYANDAIAWAGGRNVFEDLRGAQQVSAEAIFGRDPDVIISLQQSPKAPVLIAQRPGWHSLRAVREGRVVVLERGHKLIPGPRQVEAVQAYARAIHPEAFA